MWETVELREIRVFLALAEELHFRRTADRLGLTQSRVSQSLRSLEHKLGLELVHRTSRRVALSPAGERFREEISGAYGELVAALSSRQTHEVGLAVAGELRLGAHNAAAVGASLLGVIDAFEAANERCAVQVVELSFGDRFDSLRRGEIDPMLTRLPVDEPDLVVGPLVDREPRVLAVAHGHPLASRAAVSIEDIAGYDVGWPDALIPKIGDAFIPGETPSGPADPEMAPAGNRGYRRADRDGRAREDRPPNGQLVRFPLRTPERALRSDHRHAGGRDRARLAPPHPRARDPRVHSHRARVAARSRRAAYGSAVGPRG